MASLQIPREQWPEFFNTFSNEHQGFALRVELQDPHYGPQRLVEGQVFQGISLDPAGTGADQIRISSSDERGGYQSHVVGHPRAIMVEETSVGSDAALQIEPGDGPAILVQVTQRQELPH